MTRSRTSRRKKNQSPQNMVTIPAIPDRPAGQPNQIELISDEEPKSNPVIGSADDQALWQLRSVSNHHEQMQSVLVMAVVGLAVLVLGGGALRWLITPTIDLSKYNQFVVMPVIVLLTGIIAYYFGKNSKNGGGAPR